MNFKTMKKILILFIINVCILHLVKAQIINLNMDSLLQKINNAGEDTGKVKLLLLISENYMWDNPDTAIKYGLQARQLARRLNFEKALPGIASSLSEAFSAKGNYSKALEIILEVLPIVKKQEKSDAFGFQIGNVYFYSGDYAKALDYYLKAYHSGKSPNRVILGTIGESYYHLGNLDSALFYISKSYQKDLTAENHWSIPYYYLALIDSKKKEYKSALANYKLGLLYARNITLDIVNGSIGIAKVFREMGQVDSAIYYAKTAIKIGRTRSIQAGVMDASALLTELYLKINTDSAFKYQRMMLTLKDSLFSSEKIKQLENISFNEKMNQYEALQVQKAFQAKMKIYGLILGLIFLLILAFVLFRNNRHKQKAFILLQKQKQEIDIQKQRIETTLEKLKSTQSQLIQSEKMASLGELTAGIAHEIQNPLNFVNNFSDINKELIEELKIKNEKLSGSQEDVGDVKDLLNDIESNEEKINHHGRRADGIVKSMLEHSRTSTGVKEPTDINKLADEYLRLAYHGMRAKDKSFNCTLKTHFDEPLEKINVVSQDIGRVLLNLINNAFYAVSEKKKMADAGYDPVVTVSTKKDNGNVTIKVADNGNGIPDKIKEKIFQPFFTTKPTGSGTGLGLSLAYDIIKSHRGEISVNSIDGEGTEFAVRLPL